MLKISSLKNLVTDSMAIDLGTASTIIAVKGRGVVLDEPSLVLINETTEEIQHMREEAQAKKQTFVFREDMRLRTDVKPDEPHVIRMRVTPRDGRTEFDDLVKGRMAFENGNVDDQVLLKMDGFPTYHLAVVVDDHLQGVTHVIRGDDWLPSAPKHILLYNYFGWPQPQWAHVPNVLGTDGKKLSKRHGAQSVFEFRDQGYIPEALINFLSLLGWAPGGGDEQNVFTRDELFAKFAMKQVGSSPAKFDYDKLESLNGIHIRKLAADDLANRLIPFLAQGGVAIDTPAKRETLVRIVPHISERLKKLTEAAPLVDFFFADITTPAADMLIGPKMEKHLSLHALRETIKIVEAVEPFDDATLDAALRTLGDELQLKPNQLFTIVRNAVTGKSVTPPLFATMAILGRAVCLERLTRAEAQLRLG